MQTAEIPQTEIRPATDEDLEFLFHAYASSREAEFAAASWPAPQLESFLRMQFNIRSRGYEAQFPNARTYVVSCEKRDAGALIVDRGESVITLIDIVVVPEFRGRNMGTGLIMELLSEGKPVELTVGTVNTAAKRLYERLGF